MSEPKYDIDGININLDCKVTKKLDGRFLFELKNEAVELFNKKVYGEYKEASAVVSCYIDDEKRKEEIIDFLEDHRCTVEEWTDLSEDFVNNWNAQFN